MYCGAIKAQKRVKRGIVNTSITGSLVNRLLLREQVVC